MADKATKRDSLFDTLIAEAEAREAEAKDLEFEFEGVDVKIPATKLNSLTWQLPFQRSDLVGAMSAILDTRTLAAILQSQYDDETETVSQVIVLKFWKEFSRAFDALGKSTAS